MRKCEEIRRYHTSYEWEQHMKKIQVLMSTYNGEEYLREQLDSIFLQDCEKCGLANLTVVVRDDGSSDGTQKILQEYEKKYPEKFCWEQGENKGVIASFFDLLTKADADYFAFSDQDDYWLADKLSSGIRAIEKSREENEKTVCAAEKEKEYVISDTPILYCCRPKLVDEKLVELPTDIERPTVRAGFGNALIENVVTGCTIVMNRSLRDMVTVELPQFTTMHDRWLYLIASCFGKVIYDETPHILYRQHGGNVMGTSSNRAAELKERLTRFRKRRSDISRQTAEFLRIYEKKGSRYAKNKTVEASLLLARELTEAKHSFVKRVKLVRSGRLYRQRKNDNRIFCFLILLGSY